MALALVFVAPILIDGVPVVDEPTSILTEPAVEVTPAALPDITVTPPELVDPAD